MTSEPIPAAEPPLAERDRLPADVISPPHPLPDARPRPLPSILREFQAAILVLALLAFTVAVVERHMHFELLRYNPFAESPFSDLTEYLPTFRYLHTDAFFYPRSSPAVAYPPVGALLYGLLYISPQPLALYLTLAAAWLIASTIAVTSALTRRGLSPASAIAFVLTILVTSFPIAGLLNRGNIELFCWIFVSLGVWALRRDRDSLSGILFGLAAAIKLFPVLLLALLVARRSWRALAIAIFSGSASTLLAARYLCPHLSVAWAGSIRNVFGYQGVRTSQWNFHELASNHSLFNFVKFGAAVAGTPVARLTLAYYAAGLALFAVLFFTRAHRLTFPQQVLAVSSFMILLPSVSYYYALVHLYAPLVALLLAILETGPGEPTPPGARTTLMLFAPLLASFTLFTFPHAFLYGGLIQGLLLFLLFLRSLVTHGVSSTQPAQSSSFV